jgi:hypothetical protein
MGVQPVAREWFKSSQHVGRRHRGVAAGSDQPAAASTTRLRCGSMPRGSVIRTDRSTVAQRSLSTSQQACRRKNTNDAKHQRGGETRSVRNATTCENTHGCYGAHDCVHTATNWKNCSEDHRRTVTHRFRRRTVDPGRRCCTRPMSATRRAASNRRWATCGAQFRAWVRERRGTRIRPR